jgi:hypothetical protein
MLKSSSVFMPFPKGPVHQRSQRIVHAWHARGHERNHCMLGRSVWHVQGAGSRKMWQSLHDGVVCHAATRLSSPPVATPDVVILMCQRKEFHSLWPSGRTDRLAQAVRGAVCCITPCTQGLLHAGGFVVGGKAAVQAWFLCGGLCCPDCYTCPDELDWELAASCDVSRCLRGAPSGSGVAAVCVDVCVAMGGCSCILLDSDVWVRRFLSQALQLAQVRAHDIPQRRKS